LLPSPSSFYPEWGFGRSGPDSNMLPSPLTFPTPVMATGPGFGRGEAESLGEKRKGSEERLADAKKVKT
jgi:MADS-box transcription factor